MFLNITSSDILLTEYQSQNDLLRRFLYQEKTYMKHLLNMESPPTTTACSACGRVEAGYRCLDCYGPHWWCKPCLIDRHAHHPFHRPQCWKEGSFESAPLCDLGYVFLLGHSSSGHSCTDDENFLGDRAMTLVHVNGVFKHNIRFCRCPDAVSDHEQLFCHRLFPSSFDRPETAFTMDALKYYGIDSMECKTSAQSFFQKLRRLTNNAFPEQVPVRFLSHTLLF